MTSVNKKEIDKFSKMANEWWDPEGKFKPLHKFNPTRIKYIKENIINNFKLKNKFRPLSGINILDIGCGGGLLSEPMSRMGANVTGIDASDKNIKIAKIHSKSNKLETQINENVLQIEDEYYAIARAKSKIVSDQRTTSKLNQGGVDFIEIRSLDLNPFSRIGIDEETTFFLDVLLTYCFIKQRQHFTDNEMININHNDALVA